MASVEELTIAAFDGDKLASSELAVIDFAGAGTPSGAAPLWVLEELAAEFDGRCRFYRFDLRANADVAARLGVIKPCVVLYEDGIAVDRLYGSGLPISRDAIVAMVTRRPPDRPDDDCADGSCLIPP
jgi:thioredoxin-like negative regulator of GroEL